ncbi:hypothetical protein BHO_0900081 (plasmid) [Borrelia hermsii YBT]|uniref:Uncharacterized protein n=1 Tax=Borrelia hermsii YBT TaxID=1313295 RepID=W5T3J5_BORHE|nr:hypothetical protein BHO_0900081 [Borrelia hermsii YBT]
MVSLLILAMLIIKGFIATAVKETTVSAITKALDTSTK